MSEDDEFASNIEAINAGKESFNEDEQNIIDSWVTKLSETQDTDDEKSKRNEYARTLARLVTEEKQLMQPFDGMPPEGELPPLSEPAPEPEPEPEPEPAPQKYSFQIKKMPCPWSRKAGAIPKTKKFQRSEAPQVLAVKNEFEDPEEMAKAVARSKGQSFPEFIASISRHTSDFGQGLRQAMKHETGCFRDYVDNVLSQRIKDLTEVLDEEQNRELQRIKKDIEGWQMELAHVKRRIKEIIPGFDLDDYRRDKKYLRKAFALESSPLVEDDAFKRWKDETSHRLKWISDMTCKIKRGNEQTLQEIEAVKLEMKELGEREAMKQESLMKLLDNEISEYHKLKAERDKVHRENIELLAQYQGICM